MKTKKAITFLMVALLAVALVATAIALTACGESEEPDPQPVKTLSSITVSGTFDKEYTEGETFDKSGMVVTAKYSDGTSKEVTNYTVSPSGALAASDKKVTVSYSEGGVTRTADVTITVTAKTPEPVEKTLSGIEVSGTFDKEYTEGETFDKTGMVVTAKYSDGTSKEVTDYTISPEGALGTEDSKVTVSYTEGGVTRTAEVTITVAAKEPERVLQSIAVTTPPDKTTYVAGEWFDPTGMVVTATYDNGETAVVDDYTLKPGHGNYVSQALREDDGDDDKEINITYKENDVSVTVKQDITVVPASADNKATLKSGERYEAEYATAIEGTNANGKKGFMRKDKDCIGGMAVPGNSVTFTVHSDEAKEDVTLTICLAAMNTTTNGSLYEHYDANFDDVYKLSVNGTEVPVGKTFGFEGKKDQWFDWATVTVAIDLKAGENTLVFTVPELPAFAGDGNPSSVLSGDYSLYIGANFNYISLDAEVSYVPNFNNAQW